MYSVRTQSNGTVITDKDRILEDHSGNEQSELTLLAGPHRILD